MRVELPCLQLIQERFWNEVKNRNEYAKNEYLPELKFYMFPQVWGDTSLGFGGIGGQVITSAYTTVVVDEYTEWCGVFFGDRLAYVILKPNWMFYADLQNANMESVSKCGKYTR